VLTSAGAALGAALVKVLKKKKLNKKKTLF